MSVRRAVGVGTLVVVAGLAVWFAVARWDDASKIATILAALAAVAAVGVAVWAALPSRSGGGGVRVRRTSDAIAGKGGIAVSGLMAAADKLPDGVDIDKTGKSDASAGGTAVTGAKLD